MSELQEIIENAFEDRASISPDSVTPEVKSAILEVMNEVDAGKRRVAERVSGEWVVHQWIKKAVLLSFRIHKNVPLEGGCAQFYDKVPVKFASQSAEKLDSMGVRVVPPAFARQGAYIAPDVILMPSFVNIGAYVDSGTMVDTWATVGSCAQIGKNVHLSGGVGIGGVLEPLQAAPTIIEDKLLYWGAIRNRRRRHRGRGFGNFDGRLHWPEHKDL